MVEMGTDRIHHGFWKDMDPDAPQARAGRPLREGDPRLPRRTSTACSRDLLRHADDETAVLRPSPTTAPSAWTAASASTSGCARRASSALKREPRAAPARAMCGIDWSTTRGSGPRAATTRASSSTWRAASPRRRRSRRPTTSASATSSIEAHLRRSRTSSGQADPDEVFRPEDVYPEISGVAPDLIVHFGDLYWRAVGTVGGDEGHLHVRQRHRARTTPTTRSTACSSCAAPGRRARPAPERAPARHGPHRASSCWASRCRRRCAAPSLLESLM